jgi:hypothetical protein
MFGPVIRGLIFYAHIEHALNKILAENASKHAVKCYKMNSFFYSM